MYKLTHNSHGSIYDPTNPIVMGEGHKFVVSPMKRAKYEDAINNPYEWEYEIGIVVQEIKDKTNTQVFVPFSVLEAVYEEIGCILLLRDDIENKVKEYGKR